MKKMRKGFTLVELLIVVAILAILTSTMMVSMRGATAKAKAASIAANLDSCRTAALLYYAESGDKDISKVTADNMLTANLKTWTNLKGTIGTDSITYEAVGEGPDKWTVNVDFSHDSEANDIARALSNMKGYPTISVTTAFAGSDVLDLLGFGATPAFAEDATPTGQVYMNLITGKIYAGYSSDGSISTTEEKKEEQQEENNGGE